MATKTVDNGALADYDVAAGAGVVDADTQRMTLASDDPAVALLGTIDADTGSIATSAATLAGAVAGTEMQVDVLTLPALPAGTNAIGKLAANSGVDIGDVDITSIAAGTNRIGSVVARLGQTRISQTPTISAGSIYASGDAVGGLLTFANAAAVSGGTITVTAVVIIDADQELAPLELVLFDRTFTATSDNALFDPSDADLANVIGVIKVSDYSSFSDNSIATRECRLTATLNGTSLFGQLVVRSTPTYTATSDITVIVQVVQD